MHCFTLCIIGKINVQRSSIQELMLDEFELYHHTPEANKHICSAKVNHSTVTRHFTRFERTSTIRQDQIGLKAWIPRLCSKKAMQIRWIALERVGQITYYCDSSLLQLWWKYLERSNRASLYENIAKLLIQLIRKEVYVMFILLLFVGIQTKEKNCKRLTM